jgi:hypothetical protein
MVASATSPKLLVVASPETWAYGSPTGLPSADAIVHGYEFTAAQATPLANVNVAKFFPDKGFGFTTSGQVVMTPERVQHVVSLTKKMTEYDYHNPEAVADSWKAFQELENLNKSVLSSYKTSFGNEMKYTKDTVDRSEAERKKIDDYRDKKRKDRKEKDLLKYSRMDYAGGSEDVQGVDYTTQESFMATTSKILGESEDDPLQSFLDMLRIIMDFDLYDSNGPDYKRMEQAVIQKASNISLCAALLGSDVWLEIQEYLDFMASTIRLASEGRFSARDTFLEDNHQEKHYDLAVEVMNAIKNGQFNPSGGLLQSVLSNDPFEERYNFRSVNPTNIGYLRQISDMFQGPWSSPEDVVDEMNNGGL